MQKEAADRAAANDVVWRNSDRFSGTSTRHGRPMASVRETIGAPRCVASDICTSATTSDDCDTRPRPLQSVRSQQQFSGTVERFTRHYGFAGELRQRRRQQQQFGRREGERTRGYTDSFVDVIVVIVVVVDTVDAQDTSK